MKELCIDARMILSSGIGTYLKNLLIYFKSAPFKCHLLVDPCSVEQLNWLNDFELIPLHSGIYSLQEQLKLPFLIPHCDLFWSPHYNVPILPIKARKRLVTIHDVYHLAYFSTLKWKEKLYAKNMIARAVKLSDQMITDSCFSEGEILKYTQASKAKISVIPLGVDSKRFSKQLDLDKIAVVKKKHRLPGDFLLFVGNIKPHKNLKRLLEAFQLILGTGYEDLYLVIVGQKEKLLNSENLSQMIEGDFFLKNRVVFLGRVDEDHLPMIYESAVLTVFPSLYEGFGLPPLEAMSIGCPVVASSAASLPEVCGAAAEYVDPYDPVDIARGIMNVLTERSFKEDLIAKGLERASQFSWAKTAETHMALIERMVQE